MKQILQLFFLLLATIMLWGCPYDSPYGIDNTAQQPIDESLLGSWTGFVLKPAKDQEYKEDSVKINFSKNTDFEYNIAITGNIKELKPYHVITSDSIKGTAFISSVSGRQFLNGFIKGKMYIAEIKETDGNLSILCLSDHFTVHYIKNSIELRKAVEFHYKVAISPSYDDYFVLKNLKKVD